MTFKIFSSLLLSLAASSVWAQQTSSNAVATGAATVTQTETSYVDVTTTMTSTRVVTILSKSTKAVDCLTTPVKGSTQVTVTETATTTNLITATAIATSTSVVEDVTTTFSANGLYYRRYTHSFDANQNNNGFTASYFKGSSVPIQGANYTDELTLSTSNGQLRLPDSASPINALQIAIVFEGYFYAKLTGTYTFSTGGNIDNWGYLWIGDAAYNDAWNDDNTSYQAKRVGTGPYVGGSVRVEMNAGDAIPFVYLWGNGGGPGYNGFTITDPNGATIAKPYNFVRPCGQ